MKQLPDGSIPELPCGDDAQDDELGYAGLTEEAARTRADAGGRLFRVFCIDGRAVPGSLDNQPDRVNVALQDGKVVGSASG